MSMNMGCARCRTLHCPVVAPGDSRNLGAHNLLQSAALPYRLGADGTVEVLLITTRRAGRWNIPKGRIPPGLSLAASAAKEAHEEAGVRGRIAEDAAAFYRSLKRDKSRQIVIDVVVYLLLVEAEEGDWEERGQREARWRSALEAAHLLHEPALSLLCVSLANSRRIGSASR